MVDLPIAPNWATWYRPGHQTPLGAPHLLGTSLGSSVEVRQLLTYARDPLVPRGTKPPCPSPAMRDDQDTAPWEGGPPSPSSDTTPSPSGSRHPVSWARPFLGDVPRPATAS